MPWMFLFLPPKVKPREWYWMRPWLQHTGGGCGCTGCREVVQDRVNGCLLAHENIDDFVAGLEWVQKQTPTKLKKIKTACRQTAGFFFYG